MIIQPERQTRAQIGTEQSADNVKDRLLPWNITILRIPRCRNEGTHAGAQFIGADGKVYGEAGDHVSRQRNQAAAARHCVDEARQEHKRADDEILKQTGHVRVLLV